MPASKKAVHNLKEEWHEQHPRTAIPR
jgi:hypothetical protein